jgi:pilus assembly protein CpaB
MDRRKLLIIFCVAWISALALSWFLYSQTIAPKQERTVRISAAVRDLPAGSRLARNDIKLVSVLERDMPRGALLEAKHAEGRALLFPVAANEPLTASKLSSIGGADGLPATIEPGMRAVAIAITDITGVAGLLQPRSHVDVLFTRPGSMAEALTTTVLEDVVVLSVGRNTEAQTAPAAGATTTTSTTAQLSVTQTKAVTLLVSPEDARKLELAKNQGKLSVALRNPLDKSRLEKREAITAEALDPYLFTRIRRPVPVGGGPAGTSVRDPNAWAQLTGDDPAKPRKRAEEKKEPPKPRLTVDVFRGDKHLQETFQ